jgi:hypothetical protein
VVVSAPCKLLIHINIAMCFWLNYILSCAVMFFIFMIVGGIFDPIFDLVI